MDLAHCITLFIDLTLWNVYKFWAKDEGGMYKSGICDTKPAILLKRSSLEPKLPQCL